MRVRYVHTTRDNEDHHRTRDFDRWLRESIYDGGIEWRLKQLTDVVSVLVTTHLEQHPQDIGKVADALGDDGRDHELLQDEQG